MAMIQQGDPVLVPAMAILKPVRTARKSVVSTLKAMVDAGRTA